MRRFCPICGSEGQNFVGSLCEQCFWNYKLEGFPKEFNLSLCNYCFCHLHGKRWIPRKEKLTEERVIESARQELQGEAKLSKGLKLGEITGRIIERTKSGLPSTVELEAEVVDKESGSSSKAKSTAIIDYRLCNECYCLSSGKYEALVQIRADGRSLDEDDRKMVEKAVESSFSDAEVRGRSDISEIKENEGGIDLKFMTQSVAKAFVKEFSNTSGSSVTESAKIVGVDKRSGGQHFKTTIAIKIPSIKAGELIEFEGTAYRVEGYHRGRMVVQALAKHKRKRSLSKEQLEGVRRINPDNAKTIRLESKSESFGTFLDLDDMRFLELPRALIPENMSEKDIGILVTVGGRERVYKKDYDSTQI